MAVCGTDGAANRYVRPRQCAYKGRICGHHAFVVLSAALWFGVRGVCAAVRAAHCFAAARGAFRRVAARRAVHGVVVCGKQRGARLDHGNERGFSDRAACCVRASAGVAGESQARPFLCSNGGAFTFGLGEVVALLSSAALAGALVFGERGLSQLDVFAVAGTQMAVTLGVSLALAFAFEPAANAASVSLPAWGTIAFLALGCTCLAFFVQNKALEVLESSTVSLLLTGEPVFTAALSFPLLGEMLDGRGLAGAAVIVLAVICSTVLENRKAGHLAAADRRIDAVRLSQAASAVVGRNRRAA